MYRARHKRRYRNRNLDVAIRSFIATLCAISVIVLGYITASYFAGGF